MLHRYLVANLWLPVAPPLIHVKDEPLPNLKAPGPLIPRQSLATDNRCGQFNTSHREFASRGRVGRISTNDSRTSRDRPIDIHQALMGRSMKRGSFSRVDWPLAVAEPSPERPENGVDECPFVAPIPRGFVYLPACT